MLGEWIDAQKMHPPLLINSGAYKMSFKVLIYRSEWERIDIGWVVRNPNGGTHWRTETETGIDTKDVDNWCELPKIPD